jgi:uncharacterized protein (UPF0548 family)
MFLLRKPSEEIVAPFIVSQRELPFSYTAVGATQNTASAEQLPGYNVDHNRIKLGAGAETYRRAVAALKSWRQFELGWVTVVPPGEPLAVGTTVAVRFRVFGLWWLNAARIVYVIDESIKRGLAGNTDGGQTPKARFGFAYGTLPDHVERGEERFCVEWRADDSVWYDIHAFSRPKHPLVRLGYPVARTLQKRFVRESLAVMVKTVMSDGKNSDE